MAEENEKRDAGQLRNALPSDDELYHLAELFKVFGDQTRTKILSCLQVRDLCVCEIAEALNMSMSAVSHQLRVLKNSKLVIVEDSGHEVNKDNPNELVRVLQDFWADR